MSRCAAARLAALLAFALLAGLPGRAQAVRLALLVGNDEGWSGDAHLRYAESDATRLAALLTRFGGFTPDATIVQLRRTAGELRQAVADVEARLRATPGDHLVLIYYSGHADAQALHMGSTSFPMSELQDAMKTLPAATRVLILDACQAGVLTRAKGGRPGLGFEVPVDRPEQAKGLAILASSSGSELAQESDQLGGSVFTHHLQVGLAGLADRNRDGAVSLAEAFDYASERTLASTLGTTTGPQHPTFRLDLAGRDDLVLTRPGRQGAGYGQIRLDVPGWYFIRRHDGTIAAELVSRGVETLALDPGPYEVTRRGTSSLDVAAVSVEEGRATPISGAPTTAVAFGRMVRKGGGPAAAYGLAMAASARTPLEGLGPSLGLRLAGRQDLSFASLELRLGLGQAHQDGAHLSSTTTEGTAALAALRVHDFGAGGRARALVLCAAAAAASCNQGVTPASTYDQPLFSFGANIPNATYPPGSHPMVGLIWTDPLQVNPDVVMPPGWVSSNISPSNIALGFGVDLFRPPPPATITEMSAPSGDRIRLALAEVVLVDDGDPQDGRFSVSGPQATIAAPDRYLAGMQDVLVYVAQPFSGPEPDFPIAPSTPSMAGYELVDYGCNGQTAGMPKSVAGYAFEMRISQVLPEIRNCRRTHSP
jgi:hypothetical protein